MSKNNINKLFVQELINSFCYFAPLTLIAVFLYAKGISVSDVALAMLVGSIISRWGRLIFAPIFDLAPINILMSGFQFIGAIGYFSLAYATNIYGIIIAIIFISLFYGNNSMLIRVLNLNIKASKLSTLNEKYAFLHVATNVASALGPLILNMIYYKISKEYALNFIGFLLFYLFIFCNEIV